MSGFEFVASAVAKAVISRAFSNTTIGSSIRPAFRIYSMFDMVGAMAECVELSVHGERLNTDQLCGFSAEELARNIGEDVISVSLEKGLAIVSAPRMAVYNHSFSYGSSWEAQKRKWVEQRMGNFNIGRKWDAKVKAWRTLQ